MNLTVRRDPMGEFKSLQEDFNRIFNTALPRFFGNEEGLLRGNWVPSVDIHEGENEIVLEADLPGLKPGDFEVSVENYVLTLKGERRFEKQSEGDNYHRVERSYGSFTRSFTLPSTVNVDNVHAEFKDGVLRLTLPKREEVKPRQIRINVAADADANKSQAAAK
ncbi:MAG TPA: Hsp20/alpha crystallin family protein [Blastocatellia bacterium]|nr:Hsp20/alpha crystallin family protein [Blastocatellia bacterium]